MSEKKVSDWRKLVGKPTNLAARLDQPVTPVSRTFNIGRVEAEHFIAGLHSFSALDYDAFIALVDKIKQIHKLNHSVLVSISQFGKPALYATVHDEETPKEQTARLRARHKHLKAELRKLYAEKTATGIREMALMDSLAELQPFIDKKPRAKKKRRKPK